MQSQDSNRGGLVLKDGNLIRIQEKNNDGKVRISIYDGDETKKGGHKRTTINYDINTGKGKIDEHNESKDQKSSTNISCFLTTACMHHYKNNFDDNCKELTYLRWFRDNYVSPEDIKHYYTIAPLIVNSINLLPNKKEIYQCIYTDVIMTCINAIKIGNYNFAYDTYKKTILELEEEYARQSLQERLVRALRYKIDYDI